MVFLQPENCAGAEKVPHFFFSIVKDLRAPLPVLALPGIFVLIEGRPVKAGQPVGILREMSRYPVKIHADPFPVQVIHQIHKVFRIAISGGRCKIPGYLVAPGAIEGILHNPQKFHMGISHLLCIISKCMRQLFVIQETIRIDLADGPFLKSSRMDFQNIDRFTPVIPFFPFLHPFLIPPAVILDFCHTGSISRSYLTFEGIRICFIEGFSVSRVDAIFVKVSLNSSRYKNLIDSGISEPLHAAGLFPPAIKGTYDTDGSR